MENKEREAFESVFTAENGWDLTCINGCYQNIGTFKAFAGWQAAKSQATPEGFVLIGRECPDPFFADNLFADLKTRSFIYDGEEFINLCDIDPIVVWKMVIEAQEEQSHD